MRVKIKSNRAGACALAGVLALSGGCASTAERESQFGAALENPTGTTATNASSSVSVGTTTSSQPLSTQMAASGQSVVRDPTTMAAPAAPAQQSTMIIPSRPGKLDPFWIETLAESDRRVWAETGEVDPSASPVNGAADPRVVSAGPITQPSFAGGSNAPIGDGAEGLTHVTFAAEGADFDPCVSRDGSFMVFSSTQHRATSDIYSKSINGRTITQLTADPGHDLMPSISPDGGRIAFASNRNGNWDIFVMSARGGQAVQLTGDATHELHPTWSPDGSKLAFCRLGAISGRWELWVIDANNASSTEFVGFGLFPQWCPKGGTAMGGKDKIMFQRSRERGGRAFGVWTIDYAPGDAGSPTEIASSPTSAFINAAWAPDGERIVFASVGVGASGMSGSTPSDLWMSNIDGSGRVNLTTGSRFMNLMPWWAKDGRIYFVSDRSGLSNIWAVGTDKAIQAATGFSPTMSRKPKTEMAEVMEKGQDGER